MHVSVKKEGGGGGGGTQMSVEKEKEREREREMLCMHVSVKETFRTVGNYIHLCELTTIK